MPIKILCLISLSLSCLSIQAQVDSTHAKDSLSKATVDTTKKNPRQDTAARKHSIADLSDSAASLQNTLSRLHDQLDASEKLGEHRKKSLTDSIKIVQKLLSKRRFELDSVQRESDSLLKATQMLRHLIDSMKTKANDVTKETEQQSKTNDSLKKVNYQLNLDNTIEKAKHDSTFHVIARIRLKDTAFQINTFKNQQFQIVADSFLRIDKLNLTSFYSLKHSLESNNVEARITAVTKVHLNVSEGRINEIIVTTDSGVFRNQDAPIDLVHLGEHGKIRLAREGNRSEFIFLGNVIQYTPVNSYSDLPYAEFETTLTTDTAHREYLIRESNSINTYFDISVFTDIKGIGGDANGIAQLNGSAKFITNTRNVANHAVLFSNYVSLVGGISKFDNSFKGTLLTRGDSVNRRDLFQRAQYFIGLKYNVVHWVLSPYPRRLISDMQLNIGYNFVGSRLMQLVPRDSAQKIQDTNFNTVTHNQLYVDPNITFSRHKNFSMSVGLPFYFQNLKASSGVANRGWETWVSPSISLLYFSSESTQNKLFFRYNHFINLNNSTQAFTQIQLGYSANLTELLGSKK